MNQAGCWSAVLCGFLIFSNVSVEGQEGAPEPFNPAINFAPFPAQSQSPELLQPQDPNIPGGINTEDSTPMNPLFGTPSGEAPSVDLNPNQFWPGGFPEAINDPMSAWMDWSGWDSSVELGLNGSSGNSDSFNVSSGFDIKRVGESIETNIGLKYINNKSNDVLVAHNARLSIDWDKKFGEKIGQRFEPTRWSWFIKNTYYYDDFRPFDLRVAINSGAGYKFLETEVQMFKGRLGAGTSREFGGVDNRWIPEALFGLDYRRQLNKRQKIDVVFDYFPSWSNFSDYRMVSDFSWAFLLDEESNLSLKLNINNRYDSTPDGAAANDIFYSLLMLWKF